MNAPPFQLNGDRVDPDIKPKSLGIPWKSRSPVQVKSDSFRRFLDLHTLSSEAEDATWVAPDVATTGGGLLIGCWLALAEVGRDGLNCVATL